MERIGNTFKIDAGDLILGALMAGTSPIRRFIKMPGVREVEDFAKFRLSAKDDMRSLNDRCDCLLRSLFGITRDDTHYVTPPEYDNRSMSLEDRWDVEAEKAEHEAQFVTEGMGFDEDKVEFLLRFGWDLRNDRGLPLEITRNVCRVIEAVARGIAGSVPSSEIVETQSWGNALQQAAEEFKKKKRSAK